MSARLVRFRRGVGGATCGCGSNGSFAAKDFEHDNAAGRAFPFDCFPSVLHHLFNSLDDLFLCFAFNAISFRHKISGNSVGGGSCYRQLVKVLFLCKCFVIRLYDGFSHFLPLFALFSVKTVFLVRSLALFRWRFGGGRAEIGYGGGLCNRLFGCGGIRVRRSRPM